MISIGWRFVVGGLGLAVIFCVLAGAAGDFRGLPTKVGGPYPEWKEVVLAGVSGDFRGLPTEVGGPCLEWKEIVSKEGGFRILFPTEPKYSKKEMDTGAGRLVNQSYVLEEGPITFVIAWWDFPPEYVRRTGTVRILDGAKESFFKRFKGKFLKEKFVQLGAAQGRDSVYETEDEIRLRLKLFLRGNRLVQALVTSEPDLIEAADANKFFESLRWE